MSLGVTPVVTASAESTESTVTLEAAEDGVKETERLESEITDVQAAEQLPHRDLDRAQALQLFSSVFGIQLEGVAGVFGDLNVERFLSDNAAVINTADQPSDPGVVFGDDQYKGPALVESTVPLLTEDESGKQAPVDLELEPATEEELKPANPLVEVGVPGELGEGIDLPESEVLINLAGAPTERNPSLVGGSVAVYPEVAEDTSFAVAPSPTGLETFTMLQSPDAPLSQTYHLDLPEGAALESTADGGAEVSQDGEPLLRVFPPTALGANGSSVPVSMTTDGDSFTLRAEPDASAMYPLLIDPIMEEYKWQNNNTTYGLGTDWQGITTSQGLLYNMKSATGLPGSDIRAVNGFTLNAGSEGKWVYSVPRLASDESNFGSPPTSYISQLVTTQSFFFTNEDKDYFPMAFTGIWDKFKREWPSWWIRGGDAGNVSFPSTTFTFNSTDENGKEAVSAGMWTEPIHKMISDREYYVGSAVVQVADNLAPKIGIFNPPQWVGNTATPIAFAVTDTGLGVKSIELTETTSGKAKWNTSLSCSGAHWGPCPRTWANTDSGSPALLYKPAELSAGTHKFTAVAKDALGNASAPYEFSMKVDHTVPKVELSGTAVNQTQFQRPRYTVIAKDSDGTTAEPQSGIASTEITVDGKKVDSAAASCAGTDNCAYTREWALKSDEYAVGTHTIVVKATDRVGNATEKTLTVTIERDKTPPEIVEGTGTLETAPSGWIEQKTYKINLLLKDVGYGIASAAFKMDGKVVQEQKWPCLEGYCQVIFFLSTNMAGYSGGAHSAEYVVKDGAGNVTTKTWAVNVDPNGAISAVEAIDTLKAVEGTSEATPVAPTDQLIDPQERAAGNNPGLEAVEGGFKSTGTPLESLIPSEPSKGVTLESPDGTIKVTEVGAMAGSPPTIASEVASVDPNTSTQVDSVVRPIYDGSQGFKIIRDMSAPTKYSWKVTLNAGQKLEQVDPQHVAVFWGNGERALLISAEQAHDATGKEVPTELTAEEADVITLTVKHSSASFVYPVLAGPSFESSYQVPIIVQPELPSGPEEPTPPTGGLSSAEAARAIAPSGATSVVAPPPTPGGEASASRIRLFEVDVKACSSLGCGVYNVRMDSGYFIRTSDGVEWSNIPFKCTATIGKNWTIGPFHVLTVSFEGSGYHKPYSALKGSGRHLISYCHYESAINYVPGYGRWSGKYSLMDWVYPNGFQQGVTRELEPEILEG
jgi:hypothetical protein